MPADDAPPPQRAAPLAALAPRHPTPRRSAGALLTVCAAVVLAGCAGGDAGQELIEIAPEPTATQPAADSLGSDRSPAQAPDGQCSAVAELQLALTLLPLAEEDGVRQLDLASVAADARDAAAGTPVAVRDDFDAAAELLVGYGSALEPPELDELRTRLDPVELWIGRHCAG